MKSFLSLQWLNKWQAVVVNNNPNLMIGGKPVLVGTIANSGMYDGMVYQPCIATSMCFEIADAKKLLELIGDANEKVFGVREPTS